MKKSIFLFAMIALFGVSTVSYGQTKLSDEEYNYVTMDLRGILNLTMTTNPQVDFVFKTIQEYSLGITKFNATQLEVDATLAWDLYVYASDDNWNQVEQYSQNGANKLPSEILQIQSSYTNLLVGTPNINSFASLLGNGAHNTSGVTLAGLPTATTQFLGGGINAGGVPVANEAMAPGTAAKNPSTNKFRIDMKLVPEIPATFGTTLVAANAANAASTATLLNYDANAYDYAAAGYYYLEVVYVLVEDL